MLPLFLYFSPQLSTQLIIFSIRKHFLSLAFMIPHFLGIPFLLHWSLSYRQLCQLFFLCSVPNIHMSKLLVPGPLLCSIYIIFLGDFTPSHGITYATYPLYPKLYSHLEFFSKLSCLYEIMFIYLATLLESLIIILNLTWWRENFRLPTPSPATA